VIALLGNLARDFLPGQPPRPGGAPYHAARALRCMDARAEIYARCAAADREELVLPVTRLGTPVRYVPGSATASFRISYDREPRRMELVSLGDVWTADDVPRLPAAVRWLHVAPLARSDFTADALALLAAGGRQISLDGQGLVRAPQVGELRLDADYDPALLDHVRTLKLSEEEAEVLGDPAALPVPEVLITHGARGATVYHRGTVERVQTFEIDTDPTGAGDAFSIGYVAARARGFPPLAAARRACTVVAEMLAP
jgi:sugar/nucleoside kinase (ribokinase family)